MRALAAAAIAVVLAMTAGVAAQPATAATGFDHNIHHREVAVGGGDDLPCTDCHALTRTGMLAGRPNHASCFGRCHGPAPARGVRGTPPVIADALFRVCTTCHAEAALRAPFGRTLAVPFPPYVPTDFALALGHQQHREVACTQCHLAATAAPHRRCASCHDGTGAAGRGPPMSACKGCHTPGGGRPLPPSLAAPRNTVTTTFSHRAHAARGGRGAQCTTCHEPIRATNDTTLPRPTAPMCATSGCHDGAPTFPITAACTRCHTTAPDKFEVARPKARFSHQRAEHARAPCADCHPLDQRGEVRVAGHAPCASCHARDFELRAPTICGACHNGTEPWRRLNADRLPPERTEFGATLDHGKHGAPCTSCHMLTTASAQLRPPRGHRACIGTACHAVRGGPAPTFDQCDGCHQLGIAERRATERTAAAWSVRATFAHQRHQRGVDGAPLPCVTCHLDVGAVTVTAIATPPKATCAPCHDGRTAFKLTGTTCTRCHPGGSP